MEANFRVEEPKKIQATMEITMSIEEWEKLKNQLKHDYPAWDLSQNINNLITQARKVFYPIEE